MRSFLVKEGHASPVYDPPDKKVLVSPELRVMTGDVGGQDCCGGNVGDRYEEQNARGESKKPGVVQGAVEDEDPGRVEEEVQHQQEEEGVGEDEWIIEQSRHKEGSNQILRDEVRQIRRLTTLSEGPSLERRQC